MVINLPKSNGYYTFTTIKPRLIFICVWIEVSGVQIQMAIWLTCKVTRVLAGKSENKYRSRIRLKVAFQLLVLAGFSNRVHLSLLISFFALFRSLSPLAQSIHLQICHPSVVSFLFSSSLGFLLCVRSLDYRFLSVSLAWWLNVAREHTHVLWCRRSLMWSDSSACVSNLCSGKGVQCPFSIQL